MGSQHIEQMARERRKQLVVQRAARILHVHCEKSCPVGRAVSRRGVGGSRSDRAVLAGVPYIGTNSTDCPSGTHLSAKPDGCRPAVNLRLSCNIGRLGSGKRRALASTNKCPVPDIYFPPQGTL